MIFDEIRTLRTIQEAPNEFAIKIFLYLAMKLNRTVFFFDSLRWLNRRVHLEDDKIRKNRERRRREQLRKQNQ